MRQWKNPRVLRFRDFTILDDKIRDAYETVIHCVEFNVNELGDSWTVVAEQLKCLIANQIPIGIVGSIPTDCVPPVSSPQIPKQNMIRFYISIQYKYLVAI